MGKVSYSAIHKAAGLTVASRSMFLIGTIPVEQKSVHWLSMGVASWNIPQRWFLLAVFWEQPVTKELATL